MVDTLDSKSSAERRVGSSPTLATNSLVAQWKSNSMTWNGSWVQSPPELHNGGVAQLVDALES